MCKIGIILNNAEVSLTNAILFMNSNKSEYNIIRKIVRIRERCIQHGIIIGQDVVICKGPDRDVDRAAINRLISFLLGGKYQMVVVDRLTDITDDLSDLEEFLKDAAAIGVSVFELSTMQIKSPVHIEN